MIVRGLVTAAFGILLIGWPAISLTVLILLFGAFALVDGALILVTGFEMPPGAATRPLALIAGALAMAVGLVTFLWPGLTELVLLALIALRAIVVGVAEIVTASWIRTARPRRLAARSCRTRLDCVRRPSPHEPRPWDIGRGVADWSLRHHDRTPQHRQGLAGRHDAVRVMAPRCSGCDR